MSKPTRLRDLIQAAVDGGMSYAQIAAKTQGSEITAVSKSAVHNLATRGTPPGKVPLSAPQLKALARAIGQPWEVVKSAVLAEAGMAEVATFDGASVVLARAQEELTPEQHEVWAAMAEDLISLVRQQRGRA